MTFYSKVGNFNTSSGAATNTITGLGFTPVALIMWVGSQSATGWTKGDGMFSIGFAANNNGTMQYGSISDGHEDYAAGNTTMVASGAYALYARNWVPTTELLASGVTFSSGQFVVSWTTHAAAFTVYYLALGGSDITGAGVAAWTCPTAVAPATKSVTGLGFQPTCVMHIGAGSGGQSTSNGHWLGAMDANGNQWAKGEVDIGNNPDFVKRVQITDHCLVGQSTTASTINKSATYTSMDSGGFTVSFDVQTDTTAYPMYSLCLACSAKVGHWSKTGQTAAVTDTISGLGFTPSAVLTVNDSYAASSAVQAGWRCNVGASDGTNFGTVSLTDKDASYPTIVYNYNDSTNTIVVNDSDSGTSNVVAPVKNFSSGQFQAVWGTDSATTATQICYIALGAASAAPASWTETSASNVAAATIAPTLATSSTITLPSPQNVAAAIVAISTALGVTQPTPPNVAAATITPTIETSETITLSTPPNVAAATVAITKDLAVTQSTPSNVAAAVVAATQTLGVTPPPQNVAAATIAPSVVPLSGGAAWWPQVTVPDCSSKSIGVGNDITVINAAPTGPTYDGTASENLYVTEPSTATAFDFSSPTGTGTEYVRIPSAAGIDDLQQLTLEFIVYYRDGNTGNWPFLWDKSPLPNRWYIRAVDDPLGEWSDRLEYHLECTGSGSFGNGYQYFTPGFSFVPGGFYYIQITHDRSDVSNEPVIKINNVNQELTQNIDGAPAALYDDTGFDMYLANCAEIQTCGLGVDLLLFRIHDVVLTDDELIANFNASRWRMEGTNWIQVTVPGTTSGVTAPSCGGTSVSWTQVTVPDTTISVETFEDIRVTWMQTTTPATTSAATAPEDMITGWVQLTTPTTTSEAFAPTLSGVTVTWTQTVVPTTSSHSISVATQGLSILERVQATMPSEEYRVGDYSIESAPRVETRNTDSTERIITESPAQEFRIESEIPVIRITCELDE